MIIIKKDIVGRRKGGVICWAGGLGVMCVLYWVACMRIISPNTRGGCDGVVDICYPLSGAEGNAVQDAVWECRAAHLKSLCTFAGSAALSRMLVGIFPGRRQKVMRRGKCCGMVGLNAPCSLICAGRMRHTGTDNECNWWAATRGSQCWLVRPGCGVACRRGPGWESKAMRIVAWSFSEGATCENRLMGSAWGSICRVWGGVVRR